MDRFTEARRLRIFTGESERRKGRPLFHLIVQRAKELGLAGATVYRGMEGFGSYRILHCTNMLDLSGDLPVVVEIVDSPEKISRFLEFLDGVLVDSFVCSEGTMAAKTSEIIPQDSAAAAVR